MVYIIGSGGHARVVYRAILKLGQIPVFIWNGAGSEPIGDFIHEAELVSKGSKTDHWGLICGVGSVGVMDKRAAILKKYEHLAYKFITIIDPTAIVDETAEVARGVFIGPGAIIASSTKIGEHSIVNTGVIIEHDSIVGKNCHIASGAVVLGGVVIGDHVLVGGSATILQGKVIESKNVIGAGAVCLKDVSDSNGVWVGSPAKRLCQEV